MNYNEILSKSLTDLIGISETGLAGSQILDEPTKVQVIVPKFIEEALRYGYSKQDEDINVSFEEFAGIYLSIFCITSGYISNIGKGLQPIVDKGEL